MASRCFRTQRNLIERCTGCMFAVDNGCLFDCDNRLGGEAYVLLAPLRRVLLGVERVRDLVGAPHSLSAM